MSSTSLISSAGGILLKMLITQTISSFSFYLLSGNIADWYLFSSPSALFSSAPTAPGVALDRMLRNTAFIGVSRKSLIIVVIKLLLMLISQLPVLFSGLLFHDASVSVSQDTERVTRGTLGSNQFVLTMNGTSYVNLSRELNADTPFRGYSPEFSDVDATKVTLSFGGSEQLVSKLARPSLYGREDTAVCWYDSLASSKLIACIRPDLMSVYALNPVSVPIHNLQYGNGVLLSVLNNQYVTSVAVDYSHNLWAVSAGYQYRVALPRHRDYDHLDVSKLFADQYGDVLTASTVVLFSNSTLDDSSVSIADAMRMVQQSNGIVKICRCGDNVLGGKLILRAKCIEVRVSSSAINVSNIVLMNAIIDYSSLASLGEFIMPQTYTFPRYVNMYSQFLRTSEPSSTNGVELYEDQVCVTRSQGCELSPALRVTFERTATSSYLSGTIGDVVASSEFTLLLTLCDIGVIRACETINVRGGRQTRRILDPLMTSAYVFLGAACVVALVVYHTGIIIRTSPAESRWYKAYILSDPVTILINHLSSMTTGGWCWHSMLNPCEWSPLLVTDGHTLHIEPYHCSGVQKSGTRLAGARGDELLMLRGVLRGRVTVDVPRTEERPPSSNAPRSTTTRSSHLSLVKKFKELINYRSDIIIPGRKLAEINRIIRDSGYTTMSSSGLTRYVVRSGLKNSYNAVLKELRTVASEQRQLGNNIKRENQSYVDYEQLSCYDINRTAATIPSFYKIINVLTERFLDRVSSLLEETLNPDMFILQQDEEEAHNAMLGAIQVSDDPELALLHLNYSYDSLTKNIIGEGRREGVIISIAAYECVVDAWTRAVNTVSIAVQSEARNSVVAQIMALDELPLGNKRTRARRQDPTKMVVASLAHGKPNTNGCTVELTERSSPELCRPDNDTADSAPTGTCLVTEVSAFKIISEDAHALTHTVEHESSTIIVYAHMSQQSFKLKYGSRGIREMPSGYRRDKVSCQASHKRRVSAASLVRSTTRGNTRSAMYERYYGAPNISPLAPSVFRLRRYYAVTPRDRSMIDEPRPNI